MRYRNYNGGMLEELLGRAAKPSIVIILINGLNDWMSATCFHGL
jgi:hypothetical protein